ncbi:Drug/metabolite transporter [Macleaya cordata]|uniref:WAT1-related protein n=1 Tax=Macleaya cordata TaxID=56857 RepID=A0A200PZS5_MACCD|nr:Drug/metabolite transporter [Macleaya cordata]
MGVHGFIYIMYRTGKLDLRSSSSQAKVIGTVISIIGAVFVALYKGPPLWNPSAPHQLLSSPPPAKTVFLFASTPENWILGCILLAVSTLCASIWNILQARTVKEYPDATTIVTLYSLFGTIQCGIISLIAERDDLTAWKITSKMELINIVLAAVFGSVIRSGVQGWCMRKKGPLFIAMFKPFTIFIACSLGFLFFGHTFHFGSVVGSFIAAIGYYSLMWGQIKEEEIKEDHGSTSGDSSGSSNPANSIKTPLLQDHEVVDDQV